MAGGVGIDPRRTILMRLIDVFNFVSLMNVITILLLSMIKDNTSLQIIISGALSIPVYFSTIFNGPTWMFPMEFMCIVIAHVLPCVTEPLPPMVLLSFILLLAGLAGFSFAGVLFLWKKLFPDFGFISAEKQVMIMHDLIILAVNGSACLIGWLIQNEVEYREWLTDGRTLGFVLVGVVGILSLFCCIYRLVYKWKEYPRPGGVVSSVTTTATKAAV